MKMLNQFFISFTYFEIEFLREILKSLDYSATSEELIQSGVVPDVFLHILQKIDNAHKKMDLLD